MFSNKLTCRICGKQYAACRNTRINDGVFRWQAVACSPEHGAMYLERIIASRTPTETIKSDELCATPVDEDDEILDEEEDYEALFDEDE